MSGFAEVTTMLMPQPRIDEAMAHLRRVGRLGYEGIALFAGQRSADTIDVTHTLIPLQKGIRTHSGVCVVVDPDELHRINVWLFENARVLVGQIHSHPAEAYHSETDDDFPIATAIGSLSLVVPDFATAAFSLHSTAVYRLSAGARWEELTPFEATALIRITDS